MYQRIKRPLAFSRRISMQSRKRKRRSISDVARLRRGSGEFLGLGLGFGIALLADLLLLGQADGLADAVAEIEELGPARFAATLHDQLGDEGGVNREDTLDAFVV